MHVRIRHELDFSPPRLCDLRGDDLTSALVARKLEQDRRWRNDRRQQPLWRRLFGRAG